MGPGAAGVGVWGSMVRPDVGMGGSPGAAVGEVGRGGAGSGAAGAGSQMQNGRPQQ